MKQLITKLADSVTFVINAAKREDVGRTGNMATSSGMIRKIFLEVRIKLGFKERARINSSEVSERTSILGRRNSIKDGCKVGRHT